MSPEFGQRNSIEELISELEKRSYDRKLLELGDEGITFLLEAVAIKNQDPEAIAAARNACADFLSANESLALQYVNAGKTWDAFGHDLWFTRNRHGVGFWDRGLAGIGEALTEAAHKMGEAWTYQGDNGLVYFG